MPPLASDKVGQSTKKASVSNAPVRPARKRQLESMSSVAPNAIQAPIRPSPTIGQKPSTHAAAAAPPNSTPANRCKKRFERCSAESNNMSPLRAPNTTVRTT
ncbi:MAG: hypothetical protein QM756_35875 [Polyangiaceae bacterium]